MKAGNFDPLLDKEKGGKKKKLKRQVAME